MWLESAKSKWFNTTVDKELSYSQLCVTVDNSVMRKYRIIASARAHCPKIPRFVYRNKSL